MAQAYEKKFQKSLNAEREKRRRLEETVETLAKQHNKLEQVCKTVDMRSMSMISVQNHQNLQSQRSPGGTIELDDDEEEEEEDHDEFFDAMSEHPEAFGIKSESEKDIFIDHSGTDLYSDIDESSDSMSVGSAKVFSTEKCETTDQGRDLKSLLRRSASEQQLEHFHQQELGHRRAVSYDLRGQLLVSVIFVFIVFLKDQSFY